MTFLKKRIWVGMGAVLMLGALPLQSGKPVSGPGSGDVQIVAVFSGAIESDPIGSSYPGELPGTGNFTMAPSNDLRFSFGSDFEFITTGGSINKYCGKDQLVSQADPALGCSDPSATSGNLRAQTVSSTPLLLDVRMGWQVANKTSRMLLCGRDRNSNLLDEYETDDYMVSTCEAQRPDSDECTQWKIEPYNAGQLECTLLERVKQGKTTIETELGRYNMPFTVTVERVD